ncbi:MAG: glutamate synthase [Desulfobacterota bacterium]|nr:glutamate synthase [Thermodesulfobacteriota bacterium]MDW8002472.1 glutamate synthase [Deltaproteobacteria bacterium]
MCRLVAITSKDYLSPLENILALETMKEGHDGSGMGLLLKDLGGTFRELKEYPILSGTASKEGIKVLDEFMETLGFRLIHEWSPKVKGNNGKKRMDHYFARIYDYPSSFLEKSDEEKEDLLLKTRISLRKLGEKNENLFVFSFYPDVIMLKEVGDPIELCEFFNLDNEDLKARIIFAQGRQNTNYSINLYACHPFFIQGYSTMTNGENTAFVPIKEFLMSRGFMGYVGYESDSEVFTHILHYTVRKLKFPLYYYKDVITPLKDSEMEERKDKEALRLIKRSLRFLTIDGPNCVIGLTPSGTCFMVQDSKKLRPGVVGGVPGKYCLSSEVCGLDRVVPERDTSKDVYPMKYEMVIVPYGAEKVLVWNQLKGEFVRGN